MHLQGQAATCAVRCRHPVSLHLCSLLWSGSALQPHRASCTEFAVSPLSCTCARTADALSPNCKALGCRAPLHCFVLEEYLGASEKKRQGARVYSRVKPCPACLHGMHLEGITPQLQTARTRSCRGVVHVITGGLILSSLGLVLVPTSSKAHRAAAADLDRRCPIHTANNNILFAAPAQQQGFAAEQSTAYIPRPNPPECHAFTQRSPWPSCMQSPPSRSRGPRSSCRCCCAA